MGDEIEVLKHLSARAILEFEDVKSKYKEYFEKFNKEESKRKKLDAQFKQLKQVSLLAVAEYESLHKQYTAENKFREGLEEQLKKVTEENKEIRKQNNLAPNTTIISASNSPGTKEELGALRAIKDAVNDELRKTKNELNSVKEELNQEKSAHETTRKYLNTGVQQIKQLNRVSVLAINEFQDLRKKFDIESSCRKKAEDVATELVVKQELEERKSRIINEDEGSQLKKFMEEIDAINAKAEQERKESADRIKELEEQLENFAQNDQNMTEMEEKLNLVMDNLELAQKQLQEAEERAANAEKDSRNIYTRLALAEREIDSTRSLSALPPPPPPPPPPIAAPVIRKFINKIGKKKTGGGGVPLQEDDPAVTAMADMIQRIKMGVKLRSVESSVSAKNGKQETVNGNGAIGELTGLLTTLKQGRIETEGNPRDQVAVPEFARFKLKKTSSVKSAESLDDKNGPTTELKRKLEKQKSVADGIEEEEKETKTSETKSSEEESTESEKLGTSPKEDKHEPEESSGDSELQNKLAEEKSVESCVPEKADTNVYDTPPSNGEKKEDEQSGSGGGVYDVVGPASPGAGTPSRDATSDNYMEVGENTMK